MNSSPNPNFDPRFIQITILIHFVLLFSVNYVPDNAVKDTSRLEKQMETLATEYKNVFEII